MELQLGDNGGGRRMRRVRVRLHRNGWVTGPRVLRDTSMPGWAGNIMGRSDDDDADAAAAVVVVAMVKSPDVPKCLEGMVPSLAGVYQGGIFDMEGNAKAAAKARNLLLVDCGISNGKADRRGSLVAAFSIGAFKLLKGITKEGQPRTPPGLFRSILETARLPGYESVLPPGTGLDITYMSPSTVRNKFLPILGPGPHVPFHESISVLGCALKRWIQVKNWPAVTELILAKSMQDEVVTLGGLNLKSVPEQLSGITCQNLDLRHNSITQLPQWLTHTKVQDIAKFNEEPMGNRWYIHRMLFAESAKFSNSHKLICFGEDRNLQEDVLKCLKDKRHKLKLDFKKRYVHHAAVINTQQDFKMHNKEESHTWTVWSLGEKHHLFFPCFFCSNSVFLAFFDFYQVNLDDTEPPKKLFFWLDEISRCWSQSNVRGTAQIILVAFGRAYSDIQEKLSRTVDPILHSDRFKNLTLRAVSVINYFKDYEWFSDSPPFTFNSASTCKPITGKQVGRISQLLERIAKETTRPVSPRWIALSKRLRVVQESIIKWTDFVQMAASCGVGVLSGVNPEVDLEMCCDFLSDTGSIIHFRHPLWSNSQPILSQFVVLKPEWFNNQFSAMKESVRGIHYGTLIRAVGEFMNSDDTDPATQRILLGVQVQTRMPGISSWMSSLLQELHLAFMCDNVPHISFCLLQKPPMSGSDGVPENLMNSVWGSFRKFNSTKDKIIVTGRAFRLENIHEGMLTQLMNMVRQIPGVYPEVFWKTGLWVSKKCEGGKQDLLIDEQPEETINMFMRTTFSSSHPISHGIQHNSLSFGVNLGAHVLMWLNRFFQVNNLPAVQSFPCPHCLMNKIRDEREQVKYFQDVLKVALDQEPSHLKCPRGDKKAPVMKLTDIAPELSYLKVGTTSDSVGSGDILVYEGEKAPMVVEAILPMISIMREIPKPRRELMNYTGARVCGTKLWVVQKPIPLEFPPSYRALEVISQSLLRNSPLNLRELLMKSSAQVSSLIGSLLTMSLREKILRDVAKGLCHLHSQHPPLVHDGLFLEDGCIWITSLQESGGTTGPWAKVGFFGCLPPQEHPETTSHKSKNTGTQNSVTEPHTATGIHLGGSDPKTDVWNFGVLVRQVVDPVNTLQRVQVTPGHPAGRFHPHQHPSTRLPWAQPHTIAVEPQRLATVVAVKTGCSIVPVFPKSTPRWAKELMTLCWTVNPSSRPSMCDLLKAWDYFGD